MPNWFALPSSTALSRSDGSTCWSFYNGTRDSTNAAGSPTARTYRQDRCAAWGRKWRPTVTRFKSYEVVGNAALPPVWAGLTVLIFLLSMPLWAQQLPVKTAEPTDPNTETSPAPKAQEPNAPAVTLTPTDTADTAKAVTVETLQAHKKQVSESAELSDELKAKLAEIYDKAIAQLNVADELVARRQQYSQATNNAPGELDKVKAALEQPAVAPVPDVPADITLAQAEQTLTKATLALQEAKKKTADLENEPKRRADRRTTIPQETNSAKQQLEEIRNKLADVAVEQRQTELARANRLLLQLQQRVQQCRIEANAEELLFYDATKDLLAAQRDLAARQSAAAEKLAAFWQETVARLRQEAADTAKKEAIRAKEDAKYEHPLLQEAAEYNAELAQLQAEMVHKIEKASQDLDGTGAKLSTLEKDFADVRQRIEKAGGITNVLGVVLLGKRAELPNTSENQRRMRDRPAEIASAQLEWIKYDGEWSELSNVEEKANVILVGAEPPLPADQRKALQNNLIEHLNARRKTLRALSDLSLDYSTKLANLDATERSYVEMVEKYANFIDANLLWVRSSHAIRMSDGDDMVSALQWFISPANWRSTVSALWADSRGNPLPYILTVLLAAGMVVSHSRVHRQIGVISGKLRQIATDDFLLTVQATALTVLLASMWPALLLLVSWCLSTAAPDHDFTRTIAVSLPRLASVVFALSFVGHLAMPHGLAQDHFRMREEPLHFLRHHLRWFFSVTIPIVFLLEVMGAQRFNDQWYGTVWRPVFMAMRLILAAFLLILLRPAAPLMEPYLKQRRGGWLDRFRYVWYPLCVLSQVVFAVLAGIGYLYAARHLQRQFVHTIVLILATLFLRALFVRWLTVAQRRLAVWERQRRQTRAKPETVHKDSAPVPTKPGEGIEAGIKPEKTISEISRETRRLIGVVTTLFAAVGLWYIWGDVLPAFAAFGRVELWKAADGKVVTLGAMATAALIAVMTAIFARNVPGLLEIIILRRLPLDRGARFAIITVCRYILVVVGVVLAFGKIGIGWSNVQWLVAAMTVGLGFGLQEIFANFISGLIILFEQPIRIDDIVTVGDVTGKVTKIRTRATTIRKWDQREFIVPNKEFITGQLVNWTLSDNLLRRDFLVGIAYGSDIAKAERLLCEVAAANPMVLADPEPTVIFKRFGDSSLEFELRVYTSGMDNYLRVWHTINCAIDDAFRKGGIEIAFPQRDLHVRSVSPGVFARAHKPQEDGMPNIENPKGEHR